MSAPLFSCPHCATSVPLPPDNTARFQCPRCGTTFGIVAEAQPAAEAIPEAVAIAEGSEAIPFAEVPFAEAPPQPIPVPASVPVIVLPQPVSALAEEDDDPAPRRRRRSARDEDDGDEDDRRPRSRESATRGPRKRGTDSNAKVAIFACVGALLLVGMAVGGYFAFRDPPKEQVKNDPPPAAPAPKPPAKKDQPLTPEQMIRKVKNSTVYIRTYYRDGSGASGTGFFAGKPGYVVTNAHVIGYGPRQIRVPEKVEIVVDSGEPGERTVPARVFGLDADFDLAVLRVDMRDMPAPLPFGKAESLVETQEVVAFGYPFGERLGKNVSINRTTVSSLRKGENGALDKVQLAGGLNPGNSGGPVTNAKGEVIGVSVSGIPSAVEICFAIPAEVADRFVDDMHVCGGEIRLGYLKFLAELPPKLPGAAPLPPKPSWAALRIPAPKPVAIAPAQIDGDSVEVKLTSPAEGACVGGGGRFIIFHLPDNNRLAVFDVCEAKVVKSIPVPDDVLFAAGMNALVVVDTEADTIERWSLTTFTKEASADLPVSKGLTAITVAMGSASNGPLMVQALDFPRLAERFLFDTTTMKEVKGSRVHRGPIAPRPGDRLRASADGRTFVQWSTEGKAAVIAVTDTGYHESLFPVQIATSTPLPGGDGQTVYGLDEIAGRTGGRVGRSPDRGAMYVPAAHGPLFLVLPKPDAAGKVVAAVHAGRDRKPLFELPPMPALEAVLDREKVAHPESHMFFVPAARALVVLSPDSEVITLHKLDTDALLEKADDYLFVTSAPPQAIAGKTFDYQLQVKSKKPATGFKQLSGLPGLAVSDDGRVSWDVPEDFRKAVSVAVAITDAAGKEHRYEFELLPTLPPPE